MGAEMSSSFWSETTCAFRSMSGALGSAALVVALLVGAAGCTELYPCLGKACGDQCDVGFPGSTDNVKACNAEGACIDAHDAVSTCHDPCDGKACGESCDVCPPGSSDCALRGSEPAACDSSGKCVHEHEVCPQGGDCHLTPECS